MAKKHLNILTSMAKMITKQLFILVTLMHCFEMKYVLIEMFWVTYSLLKTRNRILM